MVRSGTESSILRRSLPVSAIFTTKESVPGKVEKFEPIDIQPSDIIFEWTLPSTEANGVIQKFTITYGIDVKFPPPHSCLFCNSFFLSLGLFECLCKRFRRKRIPWCYQTFNTGASVSV